MAGKKRPSEGHTVHEGPMADRRGTSWREDAARLEAANQRMIENPGKSFPSNLTRIDKDHAARAKASGGVAAEGDLGGAGGP